MAVVADGASLPRAVHTASTSPHEVTLVQDTLAQSLAGEPPGRLIGDRTYDSDPLDEELAEHGIELIAPLAPHRAMPTHPATQNGRKLRRCPDD